MAIKILTILTIIILSFTLVGCGQKAPVTSLNVGAGETKPMANLTNKKILMLIAHQGYQDLEYGTPKRIFEESGARVVTASSEASPAQGKLGGTAAVDAVLPDVVVDDYDAVIFVGGPGAVNLVGDEEANRIASGTVDQNKVLAAICIAPLVLAKAGLLEGKRATVWHANLDDDSIRQLEAGGAEFVEQVVVRDGKIITADGPGAAEEFARTILEALVE